MLQFWPVLEEFSQEYVDFVAEKQAKEELIDTEESLKSACLEDYFIELLIWIRSVVK